VINFADLLYSRSLAVFGVPVSLTFPPVDEAEAVVVTITGIDRTAGVEITDQSVGVQTVRPVVDVRRADLDAASVALDSLDGASLEINNTTWVINGMLENPTPFGPSDGLVSLLLVGNV